MNICSVYEKLQSPYVDKSDNKIIMIIVQKFVYRNNLSACQACCYHQGPVPVMVFVPVAPSKHKTGSSSTNHFFTEHLFNSMSQ